MAVKPSKEVIVRGEVPSRVVPMVFDLDGTLHLGDLMVDAMYYAWKRDRRLLVAMLWNWLRYGRPGMKLVAEARLKGHWRPRLIWDERIVELFRGIAASGRPLVIATGSPERMVKEQLATASWTKGLVFQVIGTRELGINLTAGNKAAALVARFGERGFDYAGNSQDDLAVWRHARYAIVVNASPAVAEAARRLGNVAQEFPPF